MSRQLSFITGNSIPVQLDPTDRTYATTLDALIALARKVSPEWTDFSEGDIGVAILQCMSYTADLHSYLIDRIQNESYLSTAQRRSSVAGILEPMGYFLRPPTCAACEIQLTVDYESDPVTSISIPDGFTVTNSGASIQFQTVGAQSISGAGEHTITVYEGTAVEDVFTNTAASGTPFITFTASQSPFNQLPGDLASVVVLVNDVPWTHADKNTFAGYDETDTVYTYSVSATGVLTVTFGNGLNGTFLPASAEVSIAYRTGNGALGNSVGTGVLTTMPAEITYVVSASNAEQPSGGQEEETVAEAKKNAPPLIFANDRGLTDDDFVAIAMSVAGVSAAKADISQSPLVARIFVAATGDNPVPVGKWYSGIQAGSGVVGAVGRELREKSPQTLRFEVEPVTAVRPLLAGKVQVHRQFLRNDVQYDVHQALRTYFVEQRTAFGEPIPLSDIIAAIDNTRGVHFVNVTEFHRQPVLIYKRGSALAFDEGGISFSAYYPTMRSDVIQIRWVSSAYYELHGETYGAIRSRAGRIIRFTANSDNLVTRYPISYSASEPSELPQFIVNVTTGSPTPSAGDVWEIGVDNFVGNIDTRPNEIVIVDRLTNGMLDPTQIQLTFGGGLG